MIAFKEWTLAKLEKTFHIKEVRHDPVLNEWLSGHAEISDFERQALLKFQEKLTLNVHDWNEVELGQNFIGPLFALVDYTSERFNLFAERAFSGLVDDIELGGKPDGMVASGFREPEQPYFCFQEYKKMKDPEGDPAAQALAAMLVAQALNEHHHAVYGCYVIGASWYFMTLREKDYCMSSGHLATREDVFDIFRILKVLKQIVKKFVEEDSVRKAQV